MENQEVKCFEIPYPYELIETKNGYCFDYRLNSILSLTDKDKITPLEQQSTNKNKLHNKKLYLNIK